MLQLVINKGYTLGGKNFTENLTVNDTNAVMAEALVPVAQPGVLASASTTAAGNITASNTAHGVITAQRADVFWNVGGVPGSRRGVTVGTVSGVTIPISGGAGDNLPATASGVVVATPVSAKLPAVSASVSGIVAGTPQGQQSVFAITDATPTELLGMPIPLGGTYQWHLYNGALVPFSGTATQVFMSHANTATPQLLTVGILTH